MNILLTGASGFIGKRLLQKLLTQKKHNITCLVRKSTALREYSHLVKIVQADILDLDALIPVFQDTDIVYHLAAKSSPSNVIPYEVYEKTNIFGSENVLRAAIHHGTIQKIIIMSSIAATGPSLDGKPLNENSPCNPISNYGKSKLEVEHLANNFYRTLQLPITIIRPPMVYGIGDKDWHDFFRIIKNHGFPILGVPIPGTLENLFDFCYVDNLVNGLILAAESKHTNGKTYFLSDARPYKIKEIIAAIATGYKVPIPTKYWPLGFAKFAASCSELLEKLLNIDLPFNKRTFNWMTRNYWICDITQAKQDFDYNPIITLEDGIRQTIINGFLR